MNRLTNTEQFGLGLQNFQAELENFGPQQVYPMPNLLESVKHNAHLTEPEHQLRPGLFLASQLFAEGNYRLYAPGDFIPQPAHRLGRDVSQHGVFFGRLTVRSQVEPDAAVERQVAVKPANNLESGLGELAMAQYMHTLHLPTFRPLGTLVGRNNKSYVLTEFDPSVLTLDTLKWDSLDMDEKWSYTGYATETLALLHSHALFHGDVAFRNIGFNDIGELHIVDPEHMVSGRDLAEALLDAPRSHSADGQLIQTHLLKKMGADFTDLFKAINGIVYGSQLGSDPKTPQARFKQYKRMVIAPYQAALEESKSRYLPVLRRVFDQLQLEFRRRADTGTLES